MYASLSLELFMHPLLVLFTWQKHFRQYLAHILKEIDMFERLMAAYEVKRAGANLPFNWLGRHSNHLHLFDNAGMAEWFGDEDCCHSRCQLDRTTLVHLCKEAGWITEGYWYNSHGQGTVVWKP